MKILAFAFFYFLVASLSFSQKKMMEGPLASQSSSYILIHTKTGEIMKGYLMSQSQTHITIQLLDSQDTLVVSNERIMKLEVVSLSPVDSATIQNDEEPINTVSNLEQAENYQNNGQYILSSSAFSLQKGKWILKNNPTTFEYGLSDDISIGVGSILSSMFAGAFTLYLNTKYTYKINEILRMKVGADALFVLITDPLETGTALLINGGITFGLPSANLTATTYYGRLSDIGNTGLLYSVAGKLAFSRKFSVVTENFIVPRSKSDSNSINYLSLIAARFHANSSTFDMGFLTNREINSFLPVFGIPFIAFSTSLN